MAAAVVAAAVAAAAMAAAAVGAAAKAHWASEIILDPLAK